MSFEELALEKEIAKEVREERKTKILDSEGLYFFKPALHIDTNTEKTFVAVPLAKPIIEKGRFILGNQPLIVTKQDSFPLEEETLTARKLFPINIPDLPLPSRWGMEDIINFASGVHGELGEGVTRQAILQNPTGVFDYDTFLAIKAAADYFIEFTRDKYLFLIPLWIMQSYLLPIFHAISFLSLSGTKISGKSKVIDFLSMLCFNAETTMNTSPSALFRIVEQNMACVCIDEGEKLTGLETDPDLRLLLNACYKATGTVTRTNKDTHKVERFHVFAPVAIAAINPLEPTLLSRCISIVMLKTISVKGRLTISEHSYDWQSLRNRLYRFLFNAAVHVEKIYLETDFSFLNCRDLEKWKPILAIAMYLDGLAGNTDIFSQIKILAEDYQDEQDALTYPEEMILRSLKRIVTVDDLYLIKGVKKVFKSLLEEDDNVSYYEKIDNRTIGSILRKFGFNAGKRQKEGIPYRISPAKVKDLFSRYSLSEIEQDQQDDTSPRVPPTLPSPSTPTEPIEVNHG